MYLEIYEGTVSSDWVVLKVVWMDRPDFRGETLVVYYFLKYSVSFCFIRRASQRCYKKKKVDTQITCGDRLLTLSWGYPPPGWTISIGNPLPSSKYLRIVQKLHWNIFVILQFACSNWKIFSDLQMISATFLKRQVNYIK